MLLFSIPTQAVVSLIVLVESKDKKPYELHVISNNLNNSPLARRLIREACQEIAPQHDIKDLLSNRDLIKKAISEKLSTHNLSGNLAILRMYRDKDGIKKVE